MRQFREARRAIHSPPSSTGDRRRRPSRFASIIATMLFLACSAVTAFASPSMAAPIQFTLDPDTVENRAANIALEGGRVAIYATGEIDGAAGLRFRQFVRDHGIEWAKVNFNSPGGSLIGGLQLGEVIRDLRFDTDVHLPGYELDGPKAICASACAYAFAGGINRFVDDRTGRLGIHQFYVGGDNTGDVGDTQMVSGLIVSYLARMGVSTSAFSVAVTANGQDMVWLDTNEAVSLGLANNGSQATIAEIKMTGMTPYLRLEQVHSDHTSRVLFMCSPTGIIMGFGIVTNPDLTTQKSTYVEKSYFEIDYQQAMRVDGQTGVSAQDSVLWISRTLDLPTLKMLLKANELDAWTENGGPMRWGGKMDIRGVRENIIAYAKNCAAG